MRAWMQDYLTWLQGSKIAKKEGRTENNHGNWYVTQVSGIAWYLGDKAVIGDMVKLMKSKLDVQLKPDGTQPAELARTRSFHYSYFNLQAISMMAVLAQKNGIDLGPALTDHPLVQGKPCGTGALYCLGARRAPFPRNE